MELLAVEKSPYLMSVPGIATATEFTGEPPVAALRERLQQVVELNLWLAGRLVRRDGDVKVCVSVWCGVRRVSVEVFVCGC